MFQDRIQIHFCQGYIPGTVDLLLSEYSILWTHFHCPWFLWTFHYLNKLLNLPTFFKSHYTDCTVYLYSVQYLRVLDDSQALFVTPRLHKWSPSSPVTRAGSATPASRPIHLQHRDNTLKPVFRMSVYNIARKRKVLQTSNLNKLDPDANLYPPERQLTKASEPSFDLEGGARSQIWHQKIPSPQYPASWFHIAKL